MQGAGAHVGGTWLYKWAAPPSALVTPSRARRPPHRVSPRTVFRSADKTRLSQDSMRAAEHCSRLLAAVALLAALAGHARGTRQAGRPRVVCV